MFSRKEEQMRLEREMEIKEEMEKNAFALQVKLCFFNLIGRNREDRRKCEVVSQQRLGPMLSTTSIVQFRIWEYPLTSGHPVAVECSTKICTDHFLSKG
jgi:hypothetical protein